MRNRCTPAVVTKPAKKPCAIWFVRLDGRLGVNSPSLGPTKCQTFCRVEGLQLGASTRNKLQASSESGGRSNDPGLAAYRALVCLVKKSAAKQLNPRPISGVTQPKNLASRCAFLSPEPGGPFSAKADGGNILSLSLPMPVSSFRFISHLILAVQKRGPRKIKVFIRWISGKKSCLVDPFRPPGTCPFTFPRVRYMGGWSRRAKEPDGFTDTPPGSLVSPQRRGGQHQFSEGKNFLFSRRSRVFHGFPPRGGT